MFPTEEFPPRELQLHCRAIIFMNTSSKIGKADHLAHFARAHFYIYNSIVVKERKSRINCATSPFLHAPIELMISATT